MELRVVSTKYLHLNARTHTHDKCRNQNTNAYKYLLSILNDPMRMLKFFRVNRLFIYLWKDVRRNGTSQLLYPPVYYATTTQYYSTTCHRPL